MVDFVGETPHLLAAHFRLLGHLLPTCSPPAKLEMLAGSKLLMRCPFS
jgi:hypothetical protein